MAILNLDGLVAGFQPSIDIFKSGTTMEAAGVLHSKAYETGLPGAAVAPTPGLNGAALTSYAGQLPFTNPVSGNTYLARLEGACTVNGTLILYDRLWHNSGISPTTLTAQAITSPTWPARDLDGATAGNGVLVGLEVSTATTNAGAITTITLNYTNSAGTAGRTATMSSFPATAVQGTFVPFQLQAGDTGIRSVQGLTLGTSLGAGSVVHLVAFRQLASLMIGNNVGGGASDAVSLGLPRLYDNTVPFLLWFPISVTAATIVAKMTYAQG